MIQLLRWQEENGLLRANHGNDYAGAGQLRLHPGAEPAGASRQPHAVGQHEFPGDGEHIAPDVPRPGISGLQAPREGVWPSVLRLLRAGTFRVGGRFQASGPSQGLRVALVRRGLHGRGAARRPRDPTPENPAPTSSALAGIWTRRLTRSTSRIRSPARRAASWRSSTATSTRWAATWERPGRAVKIIRREIERLW